jgi:hypothetical protein
MHRYSLEEYDFPRAAIRIFGTHALAAWREAGLGRLATGCDQETATHARFYDCFDRYVSTTYHRFVVNIAPEIMGSADLLYQTIPTFRVSFPNNVAVGEFHRDGDYNHQRGEVNFWLPVTRAHGTNSIWIEDEAGDPRPVDAEPGQLLVFDGVNVRHGNKVNTTGATRMSLDFRCILKSDFEDRGLRSISEGRRFAVGDYFSELR